MAAGSTYEPIATNTLSSAQASVTFSSFSGYTDLVLIVTGKTATSNGQIQLRFNSDSGSNYGTTYLIGDGSSAFSDSDSNISGGMVPGFLATSTEGNNIFNIQNYANTTTYKSVLARANRTNRLQLTANTWRSNSAITTILVQVLGGQNFAAGSTFTLYGILAA